MKNRGKHLVTWKTGVNIWWHCHFNMMSIKSWQQEKSRFVNYTHSSYIIWFESTKMTYFNKKPNKSRVHCPMISLYILLSCSSVQLRASLKRKLGFKFIEVNSDSDQTTIWGPRSGKMMQIRPDPDLQSFMRAWGELKSTILRYS